MINQYDTEIAKTRYWDMDTVTYKVLLDDSYLVPEAKNVRPILANGLN